MKQLLFLLISIFFSINCFSQMYCNSHLSKEELTSLKNALQKAETKEVNPYFLALYKDTNIDSVVRIYQYKVIHVDSLSFDKRIQDLLEQVGGYELWFYIRNKKRYRVTSLCDFNNYGMLYPPLGHESKILNSIDKAANFQNVCILRIENLSNWFVYRDRQLYILKGGRLIDADIYFKRKYSLDQFKRILRPIIGQ